MLLELLQQREDQEGVFWFPATFLTFLNSLLWIYIGLGFCSTCYVFFLGMPAPGIENSRQNTDAAYLLRDTGDGGTVVREAVLRKRPWSTSSWGTPGAFGSCFWPPRVSCFGRFLLCSEINLSLLIMFAVAAALWLKETLLRHECVYQTSCTISGWFGFYWWPCFLYLHLDILEGSSVSSG